MSDHDAPPRGQKGARLEGGALTDEALASSKTVLQRGLHTGTRGLQQFFTPPEAAHLCHGVLAGPYHLEQMVLDLTAGDGALISKFQRCHRFGIEIDQDQIDAGDYTAIHGDLQRVYPLLRVAGAEFSRIALNPPFGLDWTDPRTGETRNSASLALSLAVQLLRNDGEGLLIVGADRWHREIAEEPEAQGTYCTVECPDLFDGVDLACLLAFFVRPDRREDGDTLALDSTRAELPQLAERIRNHRDEVCKYVSFRHGDDGSRAREMFKDVQREHTARLKAENSQGASRYDVSNKNGRLACNLSAFAKRALAERGTLRQVESLHGKALEYFSLNLREWRALQAAAEDGCVQMDPSLAEAVERATADAARDATPLYPVKPQMRLGFLEDLEAIRCTKSDLARGFQAGETYRLSTASKVVKESGEKLVENKQGELEKRDVERERKLLQLTIGSGTTRQQFDESATSITYILEHFDVPDPGDIGSRFPAELARAKAVLADIERQFLKPRGYAFKAFQVEDLSRLLVKGKGPLGWDTGLGKTLGQLVWAEACTRYWNCQDAALFVMPQDLLDQFQREATKFFGRDVELIQTQADAKRVDRHVRAGGTGWYATHYEALSRVGRKDEALPLVLLLPTGAHRYAKAPETPGSEPSEDADASVVTARLQTSVEVCPECRADRFTGWEGSTCSRCGYVHKRLKVRSIASILATTFRRGVICVDEVTEMQGDTSARGKAVRGMRCRHPLGGSGTPISNYVDSAFFGLWWSCGNASPRFPYDIEGKAQFQRDFCVIEHTMGREDSEQAGRRVRRKILPEVTNVSVLWRLIATNMIRRRKEESGEPIVARHLRPIEVPMGKAQLELHRTVLAEFENWFTATHPDSPLVQKGIVKQFAAGCGMLPKLDYVATLPEADPDAAWWGVPASNWTPATLKVLELALAAVRAGDNVLIGSSLIDTGPFIAQRLQERGVRAVHIVEQRQGKTQTKSPRKRSAELEAFKTGEAQVLCCGVRAVRLGHNLDHVNRVILHGLPWTHLEQKQFVDRAWRLTSTRDVNVDVVIPRGSLADRKWNLVLDKGAASDLALDGQLIEQPEKLVDWTEALREMRKSGVTVVGDEVDELDVLAAWEAAEGPYAPIAPAPAALHHPLPSERPSNVVELPTRSDDQGQLAFDIAA